MKIRTDKKNFLFYLFLIFELTVLSAEQFRVAKLHIVQIQQNETYEVSENLGLNDALAIYLPEERPFIDGIEIKMTIPEQTALWRDCCGCYIYDKINPLPIKEQIDFTGTREFFGVLPGKLSWILQIPFTETNSLKTNQYTTKLDQIPDISNNFIFLRLQQIMKGIPDSVMNSEISLNIKPILSDKGILKLDIQKPDKQELNSTEIEEQENDFFTVFIDDTPISLEENDGNIFLESGIHNISVISENYRTEVRTARIDQAKITEISIPLKSIEPTLIITAPEGAQIFLDEESFSDLGKEFFISEGDHKIRFIIGDYELLRNISVQKGKTYKANLAIDLQFTED